MPLFPTVPANFPTWANNPYSVGSLNEQQTLAFVGTPISGSFVVSISGVASAAINWNDSNATILAKINAIYAPNTATIASGSIASGSLVIDFGTFSQTNFVSQMVVSANTLQTAGSVQVAITPSISQASQLPPLVQPDSAHQNNGWLFTEKPAFNFFNWWQNNVFAWVTYFNTVINILISFLKGSNLIRNGSMEVVQRGTSGTVTASTPVYTIDGFIVNSVGANTAWSQSLSNNQNFLKLQPSGTLTDLYVKQRIESVLMQTLGYTNITIQALITNNTGSTITPTLALNVPTAQDNYTSVTNVLSATNLQPITNGSTITVAYTFALTNAYNYQYGLEVIFDFAAQVGSGTSIQITNVDVSSTPAYATGLNANPPAYKSRFIQTELVNCQRYLNYYSGTSIYYGTIGATTGYSYAISLINFPATMRITPTVTTTGTFRFDTVDGNPHTVSSFNSLPAYAGNSANNIQMNMNLGDSPAAGIPGFLVAYNTTSSITISAEL